MIRERAYNGLPGLPVLFILILADAGLLWMLVMNISNLLVVLCGDRNTQPVINTGTIYQ